MISLLALFIFFYIYSATKLYSANFFKTLPANQTLRATYDHVQLYDVQQICAQRTLAHKQYIYREIEKRTEKKTDT